MRKRYFVEKTLAINARPQYIFTVLMRVESWNHWTKSITGISILNKGPLKPLAKIKVLQPKLPAAVWTVTEISQDEHLTWEKKSFGLKMLSEHLIRSGGQQAAVTIRITYQGLFARLFYSLTHDLTERYMTMEINGLKQECESFSAGC